MKKLYHFVLIFFLFFSCTDGQEDPTIVRSTTSSVTESNTESSADNSNTPVETTQEIVITSTTTETTEEIIITSSTSDTTVTSSPTSSTDAGSPPIATNSSLNIYFEEGICKCPNASKGDKATINGITYTVVDENTSFTEIRDNNNYNLCTTLLTTMKYPIS